MIKQYGTLVASTLEGEHGLMRMIENVAKHGWRNFEVVQWVIRPDQEFYLAIFETS